MAKPTPIAGVLAAVLVLGMAGQATSAPQSKDGYDRQLRIHNQTGWTMTGFQASDSRSRAWREDRLSSGAVASGQSWNLTVDDGSGACVFDFRATMANGQTLERHNVNVCQIADFYFTR